MTLKPVFTLPRICSGLCLLGLLLCVAPAQSAAGQLFFDDFNNPGSDIDRKVWTTPEGDGAYLGRTAIRNPDSSPTQGLPTTVEVTNDGFARLRLDTYNPTDPDLKDTFWGSEIDTQQQWQPTATQGIRFEVQVRSNSNYVPGMVTSMFGYGLIGTGATRDEIDFEFLTKQYINTPDKKLLLNYFSNDDFNSSGRLSQLVPTDIEFTEWNVFRLDWTPQSIEWYVNDQKVGAADTDIPVNPMGLNLNIWVPDELFIEAHDGSLTAATTIGENQVFFYDVDFARVSSFDVVPEPTAGLLFLVGMLSLWGKKLRRA